MKPVRPDSWSSLLLPPVCCLCRRVHRPVTDYPGICRSCLARLPLRFGPQQRLAGKDGESGVIAAAYYLPPVRDLLLRLKFSGAPQMSIALTGLLTQLVRRQVPDAAAVLAVPLHRRRLRERGYNQAGLLAGQLADALGLPDLSAGLLRCRETGRQSETADRHERRVNLAGAFSRDLAYWQAWLAAWPAGSQARLVLGDDGLTTGATLAAAAEPLRRAGFAVTGAVVASNARGTLAGLG